MASNTTERRTSGGLPHHATLTLAALGAAAAIVAGCADRAAISAPEVEPVVGPPVALAMITSQGQIFGSPVEFTVALPQRWVARAVLVDAAGQVVGGNVVNARWESSDTTVVRVGPTIDGTAELTGVRVGEARVTATYVLGTDTFRLTNRWQIVR